MTDVKDEPARSSQTLLRLDDGRKRHEIPFDLAPDAKARGELAKAAGLVELRKLRFAGKLTPVGKRDWELVGRLGATLVQSCVVTLEPVMSRIDTDVARRFLADFTPVRGGEEIEMDGDVDAEPLPASLDLAEVMKEALMLEIPLWPRAEGAVLPEEAAKDARDNPFNALSALLDQDKR